MMLIDSNIQYYVNVNYPKVCLQIQYNSSKTEIDNPILIFKWKCQKPTIAETPRKKRTQSNILYSRHKDWQVDQWNRIESRNMPTDGFSSFLTKDTAIWCSKGSLVNKLFYKNWICSFKKQFLKNCSSVSSHKK